MKGKLLYRHLQSQDKSMKHLLSNKCRGSKDKRHKELYKILKANPNKEIDFSKQIDAAKEALSKDSWTEEEKEKNVRRFIDFAVKEIEQLQLEVYIKSNSAVRLFLLSQVNNTPSNKQLHEFYIDKIPRHLTDTDFWMKSYYLDWKQSYHLRVHKDANIEEFKEIVLEKNKLLSEFYHKRISNIYDQLAAFYVDNTDVSDNIGKLIKDKQSVLSLIDLSKSKIEAAVYSFAQARFNFNDYSKFKEYLVKAKEFTLESDGSSEEKNLLLRRIHFSSFMGSFHHGKSMAECQKDLLMSRDYCSKLKTKHILTDFYYAILVILENENKKLSEEEIAYFKLNHVNPETQYILDFLVALKCYKDGDFRQALRTLNLLPGVANPYISMWSRLIEINIHILKENVDIAETLLNRANKKIKEFSNRPFTLSSSRYILSLYSKKLGLNKDKVLSVKNLCVMHRDLIL